MYSYDGIHWERAPMDIGKIAYKKAFFRRIPKSVTVGVSTDVQKHPELYLSLIHISQDIDYTVAMMCYIQLSLLGAAAYIKIGNSLTEPMSSNDTLENYWFTPMYFCEPWSLRRSIKGRVLL